MIARQFPIRLIDFLATLTPRERKFCHEFLLQPSEDDASKESKSTRLSSANVWQRTRRVYLKLLDFLGFKE